MERPGDEPAGIGRDLHVRPKSQNGFSLATRVVGGVNWGYCFNVLGRALIGSNRNEESLGYLQEAFEISRISNDNTAEFSALFGIGEFHLAKGDRERAMTAFRSALEVAQRDNYPEFLERAEKKLAML
ncbi:MAG TPA: tetratricopeptide repeat protein [Pyrinomonadaceae bacterium]|nr:tetratricopeptide repeat protein [Pyrinomonadaceae bacterium]